MPMLRGENDRFFADGAAADTKNAGGLNLKCRIIVYYALFQFLGSQMEMLHGINPESA